MSGSTPPSLKILLMSEDLAFSRRFTTAAQEVGIEVATHRTLAELGSIGYLGHCDVLLADTLLGPLQGHEVAEYAAAFFPGLPVLLAVAERGLAVRLPEAVVGSFCKDTPVTVLITRLLNLSQSPRMGRRRFHQRPGEMVGAG